jgi:hypothetical protein
MSARRRLTPEPDRPLPRDPVAWARSALDVHLWSKQREILQAVQTHRKVAVKACHESSKSFTAATCGAWWIAGHPAGEARIVTTAPSAQQVSSILWMEIGKAHRRGKLPGSITRGSVPIWTIGGEEVGQGRKPASFVDAETARTSFQGLHARYLLGILDEAGGIPLWLWQAFDTMATNETSRLLAIGNPDDPTTEFERVCRPGSGWHVITISAFDTPNFTGEPVPEQLRESLVSKAWVEETITRYGEANPYVVSKVFGEFPETSDDAIIPPRLIREAIERDRSVEAIKDRGRKGMDVARHGKDETCIYEDRGGMIREIDSWRGLDTIESAQRARIHLDEWEEMAIDATGMGWGVYDPLRHAGYKVTAFEGGRAATNPDRFVNASSEAWWGFREDLEAGLIDLDGEDEELLAQLQSRLWKHDASQRRIRIETKEEMAKRGISSPDRADAAIMARYRGFTVPDPDIVGRQEGEVGAPTDDLLTMRF